MTDNQTPWILDELDQASQEWIDQPEWTKPLISAPYFAARGDTTGQTASTDQPS